MIHGAGIDIIEIERIRRCVTRYGHRFLDRLFTRREQEYCESHVDSAPHFAGRFAAKEAVVKALGTGFGKEAHWLDIEILNNPKGKPTVQLSSTLQGQFPSARIVLSISHCKDLATALAIWTT